MSNGRITNAMLHESIKVVTRMVVNLDSRVQSMQEDMSMMRTQHEQEMTVLRQQMDLLKKKLLTWMPRKTFFLSRLWD